MIIRREEGKKTHTSYEIMIVVDDDQGIQTALLLLFSNVRIALHVGRCLWSFYHSNE